MAKIDLESMSVDDLQAHRAEVDRAIERAQAREKDAAVKAAREAAEAHGFRLEELLDGGVSGTRKPARKAPVKYRHPDNAELTWAGRGRRPAWLESELEKGRTVEDFRVA